MSKNQLNAIISSEETEFRGPYSQKYDPTNGR